MRISWRVLEQYIQAISLISGRIRANHLDCPASKLGRFATCGVVGSYIARSVKCQNCEDAVRSKSSRIRLSCFFVLVLAQSFIGPSYASAGDESVRAAKIRAALLYYVAKFVSWPPTDSLSSKQSELKICTYGEDSLIDHLGSTVQGKQVWNRPIVVVKLDKLSAVEAADCQIVFASSRDYLNASRELVLLRDKPILTVCSVEVPIWDLCAVQIFTENNRARLAIDPALADRSGVKIAAELLEASVVRE